MLQKRHGLIDKKMATHFFVLDSSLAYVSAWEAFLTTVRHSPSSKRTASEEFRFRVPLPACVDPFLGPIDGRPLTTFSLAIIYINLARLGGAVLQLGLSAIVRRRVLSVRKFPRGVLLRYFCSSDSIFGPKNCSRTVDHNSEIGTIPTQPN